MLRGLVGCLILAGALIGCRGDVTPVTVEVRYPEFGPEFLPSVVELFERGGEDSLQCQMVYVLWALESRIPSDDVGGVTMASVLCLGEGVTASGKQLFRLLHVNRGQAGNQVVWKPAFRVGINAEAAYSGVRSYEAKPTAVELDTFLKRAQLENDLKYHNLKLTNSKATSHHYYVRAKVYEQECGEVFGRTPTILRQHTQERHADDPRSDPAKKE